MSALAVVNELSLDDAIRQMITLSEGDPLTIARKLAERHGGDWLARELAAHWEEIVTEIARQKLGADRRSAVVSLSVTAREHGGKVKKHEVLLTSLFVPSHGWVKLGEATDEQLLAAADYRRRLASGLVVWADWLDSVRGRMREQGARRVRDLRGALPELPSGELEAGS